MRTRAVTVLLAAAALALPEAGLSQSSDAKFKLRKGARGAICLDCHGSFAEVLKKPFVHTPVKSRNCSGCHNPHASSHGKLLDAAPSQVCASCHGTMVPKDAKSTHKVVAEKGCNRLPRPARLDGQGGAAQVPATSSAPAATRPSPTGPARPSSSTARWSRAAASPATTLTDRPRPPSCQQALRRFLEQTSSERIETDMRQLEEKLKRLPPGDTSAHNQKIRRALEDNLQTSKDRHANLSKAHANLELLELELDRLENKIKSLAEWAVNRQEPDFISGQVDQLAQSMLETEKTMNDLRFATGMEPLNEEPPELLRYPPVQVVE